LQQTIYQKKLTKQFFETDALFLKIQTMHFNNFFTKTVVALFLILFLQNIAIGQCPPGATSAANSTTVNIDSGVPGGANPIAVFQTCTPVINAAAASIDVEYLGTTTTFTRSSTVGVTAAGNCQVKYENSASDPTITTPFIVTFSDNPMEEFVDNTVLLEWETVEELNNDYFEIYRSSNTKDWKKVGLVSGAGTTQERIFYSHRDENPAIGTNYYMLAQYDFDGGLQIHELKVITIKGARNNIKLYPNPVSQNLTVEVWEDSNFPLDVNIFDTTGKLVAVRQLTDYRQVLNIEELDKGFYYLQVNTERESISKRFVKQ